MDQPSCKMEVLNSFSNLYNLSSQIMSARAHSETRGVQRTKLRRLMVGLACT